MIEFYVKIWLNWGFVLRHSNCFRRYDKFLPAHGILVLIAYAQKPPLSAHAVIFSGAIGLHFGPSLQLHPDFVYANSEGSGEAARMRRLVWALATRRCDKHHFFNLMCWSNHISELKDGKIFRVSFPYWWLGEIPKFSIDRSLLSHKQLKHRVCLWFHWKTIRTTWILI